MVLNTLWHMLRGYWQTSDNYSSEGVGNLCKWQIFVRGLPTPCDHLSEDIDNPIDQFAKGYWITFKDICYRVAPLTIQGETFSQYLLEDEFINKNREATYSSKPNRSLSPNCIHPCMSPSDHLNLARQSL